jgi:hypothetical protein
MIRGEVVVFGTIAKSMLAVGEVVFAVILVT